MTGDLPPDPPEDPLLSPPPFPFPPPLPYRYARGSHLQPDPPESPPPDYVPGHASSTNASGSGSSMNALVAPDASSSSSTANYVSGAPDTNQALHGYADNHYVSINAFRALQARVADLEAMVMPQISNTGAPRQMLMRGVGLLFL